MDIHDKPATSGAKDDESKHLEKSHEECAECRRKHGSNGIEIEPFCPAVLRTWARECLDIIDGDNPVRDLYIHDDEHPDDGLRGLKTYEASVREQSRLLLDDRKADRALIRTLKQGRIQLEETLAGRDFAMAAHKRRQRIADVEKRMLGLKELHLECDKRILESKMQRLDAANTRLEKEKEALESEKRELLDQGKRKNELLEQDRVVIQEMREKVKEYAQVIGTMEAEVCKIRQDAEESLDDMMATVASVHEGVADEVSQESVFGENA